MWAPMMLHDFYCTTPSAGGFPPRKVLRLASSVPATGATIGHPAEMLKNFYTRSSPQAVSSSSCLARRDPSLGLSGVEPQRTEDGRPMPVARLWTGRIGGSLIMNISSICFLNSFTGRAPFGGGYACLRHPPAGAVENKKWSPTEDQAGRYYAVGQCTPEHHASLNTSTFVGRSQGGVRRVVNPGLVFPCAHIRLRHHWALIAAFAKTSCTWTSVVHAFQRRPGRKWRPSFRFH